MQPPQSIQFSCKLVCVFRSLHAFYLAYAALVSIIVLHILIFFNMNYVKKFADIQKNMMLFIHIFLIYSGKPLKFLFFFRANTFRHKKRRALLPFFSPSLFRKYVYLHILFITLQVLVLPDQRCLLHQTNLINGYDSCYQYSS